MPCGQENCVRCGLIVWPGHKCPDQVMDEWYAGLMRMVYGRDWELRSSNRMCDASAVDFDQCWDANGSPVEAV